MSQAIAPFESLEARTLLAASVTDTREPDAYAGEAVRFRGHLYYPVDTDAGRELWRTDGTRRGTARVAQLSRVTSVSSPLVVYRDHLYFSTRHASKEKQTLWRTDGSDEAPEKIRNFPGYVAEMLVLNGRLLILDDSGDGRGGLWVSRGTTKTTTLLLAEGGNYINNIMPFDDQLVVSTSGGWYVTDGADKPRELPMPLGLAAAEDHAIFDGWLYYWENDGTVVYRTNLSKAVSVKKVNHTEDQHHSISFYPAARDKFFFVANDGMHGYELWTTDGSADGTFMLRDAPGSSALRFLDAFPFKRSLIYTMKLPEEGGERISLWKSNATEAGTNELKRGLRDVQGLHMRDGRLYFWARDGSDGELRFYSSDGTTRGTVPATPAKTDSPDARLVGSINGKDIYIGDGGRAWSRDAATGNLQRIARPTT